MKRATLFLALCILILGLYGYWEAQQLQVNDVEIPASVMPNMSGLRIGVIADIHYDKDMVKKAVTALKGENVDMIVILGDFVDATGRVNRMHSMVKALDELTQIAPTYACLGNHDMEKLEIVTRMLSKTNIKLLRNQGELVTIPRLKKDLCIVGLGDWTESDCSPEVCLSKAPMSPSVLPILLLSHNPMSRHYLKDYSWNLMLSGHTHGGQIRWINKKTALFPREGETCTEGLFAWGENRMFFVTRGIGSVARIRFNCPPEVNILTIQ